MTTFFAAISRILAPQDSSERMWKCIACNRSAPAPARRTYLSSFWLWPPERTCRV